MVAAVSRSPLPRLLARSVVHQGTDREKTAADGDRSAGPHEGGSKASPAASTSPCSNSVAISMDGKGRCLDNVFVERLWRSLKYEEVYLYAYEDGRAAREGIGRYLAFYNAERPHQGLGYRTPDAAYETGGFQAA